MDYQQKLFYFASLIAVGIAILAGFQNFKLSSMDANINALTSDLLNIAARIQLNFFKPGSLVGNDHSFSGITTDSLTLRQFFIKPKNINGTFKIISANDEFIVIQAVGNDDYDGDGQNLTIEMKVFAHSLDTMVLNR